MGPILFMLYHCLWQYYFCHIFTEFINICIYIFTICICLKQFISNYINYKYTMHRNIQSSTLIFFLVCSVAMAVNYLDSTFNTKLVQNDSLVSPLGYFKAKLSSKCQLQVHKFNQSTNDYEGLAFVNLSTAASGASCAVVSLLDGSLMADNNVVLRKLGNTNQYTRYIYSISDSGDINVIKFLPSIDGQQPQTFKQNIYTYKQNRVVEPRFLYSFDKQLQYTNKNNWTFLNNGGFLSIGKQNQASTITKNFDLRGYQLKQSGLVDPSGQTRYAAIPGSHSRPRNVKGGCKIYSQGAFVQFDEYWPIIRVYNRDKYIISQHTIDQRKDDYICPPKTFLHKGQCLSKCPENYYKQIKEQYGKCVLSCQLGYEKDETKKICSLSNHQTFKDSNFNKILNRTCPTGSTQYEYGCICQNSKFYDFVSNTCVDQCPASTFGSAGLCMSCSKKCSTCSLDEQKINYLACKNCSKNYFGALCSTSTKFCQSITNCMECSKQNSKQICQRCSPFYALSSNKQSCSFGCAQNEILILGPSAQAYCHMVNSSNSLNQFVGGQYLGKTYALRKSGTCPDGFRIFREQCVQSCPQGLSVNSDRRCICNSGQATFQNQTCASIEEIQRNNIGYYYNFTYNTFFNCPPGCLKCDYNYCLRCGPQYILVASSASSVCRQMSPYFSCDSSFYTYDAINKICISNNILKPTNITNCQTELRGKCIVCKNNFHLSNGNCASSCPVGYFSFSGQCIKSMGQQCAVSTIRSIPTTSVVDSSTVMSSAYRMFTNNQMQISNEPITQIISVRKRLGLDTNIPLTTTLYSPKVVCKIGSEATKGTPNTTINVTPNTVATQCTDPSKQYLMANGTCVNKCPSRTYLFLMQQNNKEVVMCMTQTSCYEKDKSKPITLQNGTCASACPTNSVPVQFGEGQIVQCQTLTECQKIDRMTPFQLQTNLCSSACPAGTSPKLNEFGQLKCENQTSQLKRLNIDAAVYPVATNADGTKQKLFYFVVDSVLNLSDIAVNYYGYKSGEDTRPKIQVGQSLGQSKPTPNIIDLTIFNNKSYIGITTPADEVVLDLSKNIKQFESVNGNRLSSAFYGVRANENRIDNTRSWLAIIAYVLSLILICLHSIYIGNQLIYKVDNFLIFAQSLYYFSFVHLLINSSIGQFFYGFLWSHFGFYPNYFWPTIPEYYMEGNRNFTESYLPNSYKLLTGDANLIRNAGFSFSLLATFLVAFFVVCLVIFLMKKICGRYELWYKRIAKTALIAGFEFVSMNIFYWSVAHLLYNKNYLFSGYPNEPESHAGFRTSCSAASIAWICIYGVYMILRFIKNKIVGLYMFKRLAFATILAASPYHDDGNYNYRLFLIPLVAAELIFMVLRFAFEKPYLRRQKIFIILETVLMLIAYFTIYLWNDTGFVSIYVSLVLFLFIFLFTADLMDVYLDHKDQYYDDNVKLAPGLRHKQFSNGQDYEKLNNQASLPDTDRRLKDDQ